MHGILPAAPPPDRPPGQPPLSAPDRSLKNPHHTQNTFADYLAAREREADAVARDRDRSRDEVVRRGRDDSLASADSGAARPGPHTDETSEGKSPVSPGARDDGTTQPREAPSKKHADAARPERGESGSTDEMKAKELIDRPPAGGSDENEKIAGAEGGASFLTALPEKKRSGGETVSALDRTGRDDDAKTERTVGRLGAGGTKKGLVRDTSVTAPSPEAGGLIGEGAGKGSFGEKALSAVAGTDGTTEAPVAGEQPAADEMVPVQDREEILSKVPVADAAEKVSVQGAPAAGLGDPRTVGDARGSRGERTDRSDRARHALRGTDGAKRGETAAKDGVRAAESGRDSADVPVSDVAARVTGTGDVEAVDAVENRDRSDGPSVTIPVDLRSDTTPGNRLPTLAQATDTLARRLNGELGQNIVRQARIMLQDADRAELRLIIRPPELGRVRIKLQLENGHIAGRILVDNGNVREVIEQNLSALQRAFEEAGLAMGDLEVSTGDARDEGDTTREPARVTGTGNRRGGVHSFDERIEVISEYETGRHRVNLVA